MGKLNIEMTTHEYTGAELAAQREAEVVTFEARKKTSFPSRNGLYVAEILLLEYCSYGSYPRTDGSYPRFWWYQYGIRDVSAVLKSLEERSFIRFASAAESLPSLTVAQLKEVLAQFSLPVSGKKADLIQRIKENVSEDDLDSKITDRQYTLTELGRAELEENQYVPYMHSFNYSDITVWTVNQLMQKYPAKQWRDAIWGELNRLTFEYMKQHQFGLYRNTKYAMYKFLLDEDRNLDAFNLLAEVLFYDLNNRSPVLAPGITPDFAKLQASLHLSDEELSATLHRVFADLYAPVKNFSTEEVSAIINFCVDGNPVAAQNYFDRKLRSKHSSPERTTPAVQDTSVKNEAKPYPVDINPIRVEPKKEKKSGILSNLWLYIGFAVLLIYIISCAVKEDTVLERAAAVQNRPTTSSTSDFSSDSKPTKSQKNALSRAKQYLDIIAYSKEGLIDQLEYEKYSHADAVYAAEHCGADWYEQAVKKAKDYLDLIPYSRDGLIDQLEYEGFTHEQALYGAKQNGL